jgi:hypothetical protein
MSTILEAGPALDRKAAEVVMGWTAWQGAHVETPEGARTFSPSTDLRDAFVLVDEVLRVCRGQFRLKRGHSKFSTVLFFGWYDNRELEYGYGVQPTEALAICEATMMAMVEHRKIVSDLAALDLAESIYEEGM